jgi:hypothetical protein
MTNNFMVTAVALLFLCVFYQLNALNQNQRSDVASCINELSAFLTPEELNRPGDEEFREVSENWVEAIEKIHGTPPAGKLKKTS